MNDRLVAFIGIGITDFVEPVRKDVIETEGGERSSARLIGEDADEGEEEEEDGRHGSAVSRRQSSLAP